MKITKEYLKRVIKEELENIKENDYLQQMGLQGPASLDGKYFAWKKKPNGTIALYDYYSAQKGAPQYIRDATPEEQQKLTPR